MFSSNLAVFISTSALRVLTPKSYFKLDTAPAKAASATGSSFSVGNLALAGVAGLGVGAVVTALLSKSAGRKKKESSAA